MKKKTITDAVQGNNIGYANSIIHLLDVTVVLVILYKLNTGLKVC